MKLLHNILRGSTLATALFIFQSCYGMPQNLDNMLLYEAKVKVTDSKGKALEGVKVSAKNTDMSDYAVETWSDADGLLDLTITASVEAPSIEIRFEADGYAVKDTTILDVRNPERDFKVKLEASK